MIIDDFIKIVIIIVILGLITGIIFNKLRLPFFLGYILVGIIINLGQTSTFFSNVINLRPLADIGIALLLFSIGLEISFKELKTVKFISIFGTFLQFLITSFFGYWLGVIIGFNIQESVLFGIIISLSSTVIVLKLLENKKILNNLSSKIIVGMLIVQDIIAVPIMIIIPNINNLFNVNYIFSIFIAIIVTILIIFLGNKIIQFIFKKIARSNSQELFLLSVATIVLGLGYISFQLKLSFEFGAFLAGIILNKTDYNHRALSDIIPLRDIFGLIFFVSIGLLFDINYLLNHKMLISFVVITIIILKFLIFFLICFIFKYKNIVSIIVGLGLSQVGEFSFIITLLISKNIKVISSEFSNLLLSVTIITMFLTPFIFMLSTVIYKIFIKLSINVIDKIEIDFNIPHIIIVGYGRIGANVSSILYELNIPFILIEKDYRKVELAKKNNYIIIYGDICNRNVITKLGIENAKLLINTVPIVKVSKEIVNIIKEFRQNMPIIMRVEGLEQMKELSDLDIKELVQPELEASIEIIKRTMILLELFHVMSVQQYIDDIKYQKYSSLYFDKQIFNEENRSINLQNISNVLRLYWIEINNHSTVINKSIDEIKSKFINTSSNVFVVGIFRAGLFYQNPNKEFLLNLGDFLAVISDFKNVLAFEKTLYEEPNFINS